MHRFSLDLRATAAYAVMGAAALAGSAPYCRAQAGQASSQPQKKYKEGEYEVLSQAYKDAGDPSKAISDLDAWTRKFPDSDFRDDRAYLYVQACSRLNQPAKVLEYGAQLMARDLKALFNGPGGGQLAGLPIKLAMLNVLYSVALQAASLPGAAPEQLALGDKAVSQLLDLAPKYFTPENKPSSQTDAAWSTARAEVMNKAKAARVAMTLRAGIDAQQKNDCAAAEKIFSKTLADYPESGTAAYHWGVALLACEAASPEKVALGLWEISRAGSLDPATSGLDPKDLPEIGSYLKKVYIRIHGSEDGLDQLRSQAAASPAPPAGFRIRTVAEIAQEKQAEFESSHPQIALWMKIKAQLADPTTGDQYFQGQLKDAAVPQLSGRLVEARPACHPRELLVVVPVPNGTKPLSPEISLKLDKPLGGQPESDQEFRWEGVPAAFTKDPFLLTMETETAKVVGLTASPCTAAPEKPGAKRGIATKK
ncbi:MAG TPA: hypothetical protein VMH81_04025 [Bryobacteraceae bacterium]|nr:hypothetical protein [Bryobacteraceae bacterium]